MPEEANFAAAPEAFAAHVKAAKNDEKAMTDGSAVAADATPPGEEVNKHITPDWQYRYGVYLVTPTKEEADKGLTFGARVVQIGPPICADRKASATGKCDGAPIGYGYKENPSPTTNWALMELGEPAETIATKRLIPIAHTDSFDAVIKGGGATVAEIAYKARVKELSEIVTRMVELASYIHGQLNSKANEKHRFTFFL